MTIAQRIERFLLKEIGADLGNGTLDPNADLLEQRIIDSLAILKLVSFLEETFAIKVRDEDIVPENFQSLNCLVRLVEQRKQESYGGGIGRPGP
jgi:acyl carrier protein